MNHPQIQPGHNARSGDQSVVYTRYDLQGS